MRIYAALLSALLLLWSAPASAQQTNIFGGTGGVCSSFGTTAGTCAQGGVVTAGGPTGSATVAPVITYNAAGQLTTVTSATITPAIGSITGLGSGNATALGNVASTTGGFPIQTGPLSWTPSDASGASLTFTSVSVNYTQIGNQVCVYGRLTYPTTADASQAKIGGLPVTSANAIYAIVGAPVLTTAAGILPFAVVNQNATTLAMFTQAIVNVTNVQLSGSVIIINLCYPAA